MLRAPDRVNTSPGRAAFTLVELMVSMGVIALVMLILVSTVDQTQRIWTRTTNKISQFQAARAAFDSVTRNLSQATLNAYYGVEYDDKGNPRGYYRESELHFVTGRAAQPKLLGGDETVYPTHAAFFQAPIGLSAETAASSGTGGSGSSNSEKIYRNLNHLLSGVGYYIEWGEDKRVPDFLKKSQQGETPIVPKRHRFRLMELMQPAESLSIYATEDFFKQTKYPTTTDWIQVALGKKPPVNGSNIVESAWVRAENVIALVLLPKIPERDRTPPGSEKLDLAPEYEYDTRPTDSSGRRLKKETLFQGTSSQQLRQFNQLPPVVQVVMVAIDEPSAIRQQAITGDVPPEWTKDLFKRCDRQADLMRDLGDPINPLPDSLSYRLGHGNSDAPKMEYRIYSADVVLRGAKWTAVDIDHGLKAKP